MGLKIREFTPADYPAVVLLAERIEPEYPTSADELRHWDEHREAKICWRRYIAEWDGEPVGYGDYNQAADTYHPHKFSVSAYVLPGFRRRGVGGALLQTAMNGAAQYDPIQFTAEARENCPDDIAFLERRGFVEKMREWESRLYLDGFDFSRFAGAQERIKGHGIQVKTLTEFRQEPDWDRRLLRLEHLIEQDIPSIDEATEQDLETWRRRMETNPRLLPDAWFIAIHEGEPVGLSRVASVADGSYLDTGLTGVVREHRRKGIALALKLRVVEWALAQDAREIRTWNEVDNPMFGINVLLGFQKQPAWIFFAKQLNDANSD